MTVSTTDSQIDYSSGGPSFPIPFKFLRDEDIQPVLTLADGSQVVLTQNVQYTLTGSGNEGGGTLTSAYAQTAIDSGALLRIARIMQPTQETDLRNQGRYFAETHERVFDRLTMLIQQALTGVGNSLSLNSLKNRWDFKGLRGVNVGDPIDPKDVANKGYVDTSNAAQDTRIDALSAGLPGTNYAFPWSTTTTTGTKTLTPGFEFASATLYINGIAQTFGKSFAVSGNQIVLAQAVPAGTEIYAILGQSVVPTSPVASSNVTYKNGTVEDALRSLEPFQVSVLQFGAVGDASTDSAQAFQDAIDFVASRPGGGVVRVPNSAGYFMSKGIVVRRGAQLQGDAIFCENYQGAGPVGARLIFASGVALCVHVSGAVGTTDASGTPGLRRVIVTRTGSIPSGSEGVRISGAANSTLEDVFSDRHAKGFRFLGKGSSTDPTLSGGLACNATRLYTGAISDAHFEIDSWPELRVTGGRSGMNGTGNLNGTCFVRITSPQGGTGGAGPNTIIFMNYQFNQGQVGPAYWLEFINNTAGAGNQVVYEFTNCHVENISSAYIKSYANSQYIQKLQVTGGTLNTAMPLFALDPATNLGDVTFNGVDIAASTVSVGSLYVNGLKFDACGFTGTTATLTAPTANNWVVTLSGNTWQATSSLTLAGSGWASCHVNDVFGFDSNVMDNTGSKAVYVTSVKRNLALWIPALQIGGASTGITYSATNGVWQLVGRMLTLNFRISLSSKGALTGPITIGNLPFPPAGNSLDGHSGAIGYAQNFVGLTGALALRVQDTTKLEIRQSNANGNVSISEANLANNTFVTGSITYAI